MTRLAFLTAVALALAPAAYAQQSGQNASFNLVNKSALTIKELFATPAGMDNWGKNRLDGRTIAAGGSFAVRLPANGNCRYDIRVVTGDGRTEDRRGVDTCKMDDVVFAGGGNGTSSPATRANLKLINNGASPIAEFYARRPGASDWGANRLATGDTKAAIAPSAALAVPITLDGNCAFDLRVVFENRQSREKRAADLCRTTELPVK